MKANKTSWANWKANFLQAFGFDSIQYSERYDLAKKYYRSTGGNIHFTGHSLGGGIAASVAIRTSSSATVFNAAGVHNNTLNNEPRNAGSIKYYYSSHDVLRLGNRLTPSSVPGRGINFGSAGLHGIGGVCRVMGGNC